MFKISIILLSLIIQCFAYQCPQSNGLFRDPENPHKYYDCVNGQPFLFTCPEDLVFDESKQTCDFAHNVKTGTPVITNAGQTTATTRAQTVTEQVTTRGQTVVTTHGPEVSTNKVSCDGKPGFTKDASDTHKFHECVNGVLVTFTCPEHLVFSEAKQACDFESGPVTNPSESSKSTSSPSSHSCPQPNGFFRDPQNAHKFIECVDGTAYSFICPDNLIFDEKTKVCVFDDKASTPSGPVTTRGVSPDCVGKTGFFKDPSDKHKFFECNNGLKELFTCPENLAFDEALGRCVIETTGNPNTSHTTPTAGPTEHPQTEGTRPRHTNPSY